MPIFEFVCKKCGHNFEELLSFAELENRELKCPACRSKRIERGFSAFATGAADSTGGFPGGGCGSGGFT